MPPLGKDIGTTSNQSPLTKTTRSAEIKRKGGIKSIDKLVLILLCSFFLLWMFLSISQIQVRSKITLSSTVDTRDSQVYKTIAIKGKTWMAQNLNYDDDTGNNSWVYKSDTIKGKKYGRLYTWESAMKACPNGWHLPSKKEWHNLTKQFGGIIYFLLRSKSTAAYKNLILGGESAFKATLDGRWDVFEEFDYSKEEGYYWARSESEAGSAWTFYFNLCYFLQFKKACSV